MARRRLWAGSRKLHLARMIKSALANMAELAGPSGGARYGPDPGWVLMDHAGRLRDAFTDFLRSMDDVLALVDWPLDSAPFNHHMAVIDDAHVAYNQCNLRLAATMAKFPKAGTSSCYTTHHSCREVFSLSVQRNVLCE